MLRKLRIAILLYVLMMVAMTTYATRARNTAWDEPLWVAIYPINGETAPGARTAVADYVAGLTRDDFMPVADFIRAQARTFGVGIEQPLKIVLAPALDAVPPAPPTDGNPLAVIAWSLRLRAWSWLKDTATAPHDVQLFVVYFDPASRRSVAHSLGLQKGHLGVVNGFGAARYRGRNNVVIAHELLHTLGASDKYDRATGLPRHPDGYADPRRVPRHPQTRAELMAGKIPLSDGESRMPDGLGEVLVGPLTAAEIGWSG